MPQGFSVRPRSQRRMLRGVTFTSVAVGGEFSVAIGDNGHTYAWGRNDHGQLGTGGPPKGSAVPMVVSTGGTTTVTSITFGGVPGPDLYYDSALGRWTVTTPPHAAGPVDVVVNFDHPGATRSPIVYASGFTCIADPAGPGGGTVPPGDPAGPGGGALPQVKVVEVHFPTLRLVKAHFPAPVVSRQP